MEIEAVTTELCVGCGACLIEPYVRCMQCPCQVFVCLHCFARGLEKEPHRNNHKFEVIKNDFSLFEKSWTAAEERKFLDLVAECGIGNWTDIASQLRSKSGSQCEEHYTRCYIENPMSPLPVLPEADITRHPTPVVFRPCEDPPRPTDGSTLQQDLSGYMAARGDFTVEHDNYAELDLRDIEFQETDSQTERELKLGVLAVYRHILMERQRRKRIVREYGLINLRKHNVKERRYFSTIGLARIEKLRCFMRVLPPEEWDMYLESLHYESQLKQDIRVLQEYHEQGVVKLISADVYRHLKSKRVDLGQRKCMLNEVCYNLQKERLCGEWLGSQSSLVGLGKTKSGHLPNPMRKLSAPLDIVGMPNYEKLSEAEQQLCSRVRLVPDSYLQYKTILLHEYEKHGTLSLQSARVLVKIDVNKTRKIFDFLVKEGYIVRTPNTKKRAS